MRHRSFVIDALRVLIAAMLLAAPPAYARFAPDIEDFNPPYSRKDAEIARALAAYDAEQDSRAEAIIRPWLARRDARGGGDPLPRIEGRFILARVLDSQQRYTEAETVYREGLSLIAPLLKKGTPVSPAALAKATTWARLFDILLRDNLRHQDRYGEAEMLVSLLPRPANPDSRTEWAVSSLPPIKSSPCSRSEPDVRRPTPEEQRRWDDWDNVVDTVRRDDPAKAEMLLRRMIALDDTTFGPRHCMTIQDRFRLLDLLADAGDLGPAEQEGRALVGLLDMIGETRPQTAGVLGLLGDVVSRHRGQAEGEPFLRRALAVLEKGGNRRDTDIGDAHLALAANLYAQNRLAESEELYREALRHGIGDEPLLYGVRQFTAMLAERQGKMAEAAHDYRAVCAARAERAAQSGRGGGASQSQAPGSEEAAHCSRRQARLLHAWALAGGGAAAEDRPDALLDQAFAAAQRALSSPSAEAMARATARQLAVRAGAGELAERYEAAVRRRDEAGLAPRPAWYEPIASYTADSDEAKRRMAADREIAELSSRLSAAAPLYWDVRMPRPMGISAVQALLRRGEALVYAMLPASGQGGGLVFAVSRDRAGWARVGMDMDELRDGIARLRGAIDAYGYGVKVDVRGADGGYPPFDRHAAHRIYQALFGAPEIAAVIARAPVMIVVPTGPFAALPPGLLVTRPPEGEDGWDPEMMRRTPWLLRDKAIAVLPSVASLRLLRSPASGSPRGRIEPLLAFANPSFGTRSVPAAAASERGGLRGYRSYFRGGEPDVAALGTLAALPSAETEAIALARALRAPRDAVLTGAAASKAELMKRNADGRLARTRVVEFATHGLVAGEGDGIAEPALVLAAAAEPRDWLLTASDAAGLRIGADWVLLSACNTASPDGDGAEGLSGLARGFFYAGARALLVSHWRLADETAAVMVPDALGRHAAGLSRAEALRRAALAILDDRRVDRTDPFYWAPFVLIGEPS